MFHIMRQNSRFFQLLWNIVRSPTSVPWLLCFEFHRLAPSSLYTGSLLYWLSFISKFTSWSVRKLIFFHPRDFFTLTYLPYQINVWCALDYCGYVPVGLCLSVSSSTKGHPADRWPSFNIYFLAATLFSSDCLLLLILPILFWFLFRGASAVTLSVHFPTLLSFSQLVTLMSFLTLVILLLSFFLCLIHSSLSPELHTVGHLPSFCFLLPYNLFQMQTQQTDSHVNVLHHLVVAVFLITGFTPYVVFHFVFDTKNSHLDNMFCLRLLTRSFRAGDPFTNWRWI